MAVDYAHFINEAEFSLSVSDGSEIKCRSAVSRAYYGVYHAALEYADSLGDIPVSACGGSTHKKLWAFYKENLDSDRDLRMKLRKVGYVLKQLHELRVTADYRLQETISIEDAECQLTRSRTLLEAVEQLKASKAA